MLPCWDSTLEWCDVNIFSNNGVGFKAGRLSEPHPVSLKETFLAVQVLDPAIIKGYL